MIFFVYIVGYSITYLAIAAYTIGFVWSLDGYSHKEPDRLDFAAGFMWPAFWTIYLIYKFFTSVLALPKLVQLGYRHQKALSALTSKRARIAEERKRIETEHMAEVEAALREVEPEPQAMTRMQ